MNMSCFNSEGLRCQAQLSIKRGKKGKKKMAVTNSWSWRCSQVNLCGFIWPWFGANEQMERVTKNRDSSLLGETHNTVLLSPVIKKYSPHTWCTHAHTQPHTHTQTQIHTHTHAHKHTQTHTPTHTPSIIQGWRQDQLKERLLQGLLDTGWKLSAYQLRFLPEFLLCKTLHKTWDWSKICVCERETILLHVGCITMADL